MTTVNAVNTHQLTTNGQLLIGNTGNIPSVNTLTAGSNITVTNGAGSITIAGASGSSGLGIGGISGNWYASGSTFGGTSTPRTGANSISTGTLYFVPFFNSASTTYTDIGRLTGSTAAGNSILGIYNDSGNMAPTGSPISNSNSTALTNTTSTFNAYTFSSPITLGVGVFWLAFTVSNTTIYVCPQSTGYEIGGRGMGISGSITSSSITAGQAGWSQSFVYSTTLPSVGSLSVVNVYAVGDAYVFLKAQ